MLIFITLTSDRVINTPIFGEDQWRNVCTHNCLKNIKISKNIFPVFYVKPHAQAK